eukprot:CAMPEP_0172541684 /NCGR_PEP_ID=MMETSP1067-20121228/12458_1 /TAXON_ID=265564 ORGANISM="Thalassiosira punctigera, Strain Tpunct2005C2" /NCGR_SAMPLE_ID=MMETSP1067 /ASSEMBLY_ACC=CAM_ASM_000444 /LENGTH=138 /DNA_ID=CAMNT_0013327771 /DNA_START=407 /DNA_END=823 /DNA_ORIENTATION=-
MDEGGVPAPNGVAVHYKNIVANVVQSELGSQIEDVELDELLTHLRVGTLVLPPVTLLPVSLVHPPYRRVPVAATAILKDVINYSQLGIVNLHVSHKQRVIPRGTDERHGSHVSNVTQPRRQRGVVEQHEEVVANRERN